MFKKIVVLSLLCLVSTLALANDNNKTFYFNMDIPVTKDSKQNVYITKYNEVQEYVKKINKETNSNYQIKDVSIDKSYQYENLDTMRVTLVELSKDAKECKHGCHHDAKSCSVTGK